MTRQEHLAARTAAGQAEPVPGGYRLASGTTVIYGELSDEQLRDRLSAALTVIADRVEDDQLAASQTG